MKTYMTLQAKDDEERDALEREVARLREALRQIAGMPPHGYGSEMAFAMATIAVMALEEGSDGA